MAKGGVAAKLRSRLRPDSVRYALGRFRWVRRAYSRFRRLAQAAARQPSAVGVAVPSATLFGELDTGVALQSLRRVGMAELPRLAPSVVEEIRDFAESAACRLPGFDPSFHAADVVDGRIFGEQPAALAYVVDPAQCGAVRRVIDDPGLLALCGDYLGYRPGRIEPRLVWSFVTSLSPRRRLELFQTVSYHYDVDGYNFVYVNFYLTDVDRTSGAHVMLCGSHLRKPLGMLFASANQSDDRVLGHYGAANELVIEGPAGSGFVQDASCFHKALAPLAAPRLLLQLRCR